MLLNKVVIGNIILVEDNFDIPLLSDVKDTCNERELEEIEEKINSVKNRLGLLVNSDNEDDSLKSSKKEGCCLIFFF